MAASECCPGRGSSADPEVQKNEMLDRKKQVTALAVPWAGIILAAVVASTIALLSAQEQPAGDEDLNLERNLAVYNEEHEPLFPLSQSDRYGFTFAVLGLMIAAGGGIGGGGIIVPIYILVLGFSPKHAIPLSNVTVFGGAVANTLLNVPKRHPLANRPLVDWDLILVMEPLTIAGALIGAFLNKVLPELLLTVLLVLLLSFTAYESLKSAVKMYKKETAQFKLSGLREDGTKESELTRMANKDEGEDDDEAATSLLENAEKQEGEEEEELVDDVKLQDRLSKKELDEILEQESHIPKMNITILLALFVVVLAINLLKGGGAFPSPLGIRCGSTSFWVANAIMIGWILVITVFVRYYLVRKHERKLKCNFEFVEGDIKWDARASTVYPIICAAAGFFAGMFGVGGGIVKGPLMLAMGVHPKVGSASSACMILFTSFTATTSYFVFGLLVPDYSVFCLFVGFTATIVGQLGLGYLMKQAKAQRNSYIAFSIGAVVLLSAFLMTIQSLLSMAEGEKHHSGGICGKGD